MGSGDSRGIITELQDCGLKVSEFELRSNYYVDFRTNNLEESLKTIILSAFG